MDIILSCTKVKLKVPPVESTALSWIKLLKGAQPVPKNTENSATNSKCFRQQTTSGHSSGHSV